MLCPPHDAALPGITPPARGGYVGAPRNRYSWLILQGQGKQDPTLRGGWGRHAGHSIMCRMQQPWQATLLGEGPAPQAESAPLLEPSSSRAICPS